MNVRVRARIGARVRARVRVRVANRTTYHPVTAIHWSKFLLKGGATKIEGWG